MSTTTHNGKQLNLREQITRIDRNLAETEKLFAENHRLVAEAKKVGRDPWFLVIGAVIAGLFFRLPEILRALGIGS